MPSDVNSHNNQESWDIDNQEKCTFLPKHADSNKQPYLVNIWKTMPFIPRALPKILIVFLGDSIYQNAPECRPSVAPQIPIQNYRSLYREDNREFNHRWLDHGMTLQLSPWNGDYDEMTVSTKLDPSYCNSCVSEHPRYDVYIDGVPAILQLRNESVR